MGEKALWPMVAVVGVLCLMITGLAYSDIEPIYVIAIIGSLFTGIGTVVSIILYGKVAKVEQNTNGTMAAQQLQNRQAQEATQLLVRQLIEDVKKSVPVDMVLPAKD